MRCVRPADVVEVGVPLGLGLGRCDESTAVLLVRRCFRGEQKTGPDPCRLGAATTRLASSALAPIATRARRQHAPARHIPQAHRTRARRSVVPRRARLQVAHADPRRGRSCRRTDRSSSRLSHGQEQPCQQTTLAPTCRAPLRSRQRPQAEARPQARSAPGRADARCPRGRRQVAARSHLTRRRTRLRPRRAGMRWVAPVCGNVTRADRCLRALDHRGGRVRRSNLQATAPNRPASRVRPYANSMLDTNSRT